MSRIVVDNLVKSYGGDTLAVDGVSFTVEEGSLTVLLGESGCGKSTTLRMIAGLEDVTSGTIRIGDRDVTHREAAKRSVSMVFQNYALFPHLSVEENILFGLKVRKVEASERKRRLREASELVGLSDFLNRKPAQLSGGQRQRVALARTIVAHQPVCLMDEPLSNLDAKLRASMRNEIRELQQRLGLTMVYVTHDQIEAMTMADQVVLLNDGEVVQADVPGNLYDRPATNFVARFIGQPPMNILNRNSQLDQNLNASWQEGWHLGIRPEEIRMGEGPFQGAINSIDYLGSETVLWLDFDGQTLAVKLPGRFTEKEGSNVSFGWAQDRAHWFDADGVRRDGLQTISPSS